MKQIKTSKLNDHEQQVFSSYRTLEDCLSGEEIVKPHVHSAFGAWVNTIKPRESIKDVFGLIELLQEDNISVQVEVVLVRSIPFNNKKLLSWKSSFSPEYGLRATEIFATTMLRFLNDRIPRVIE